MLLLPPGRHLLSASVREIAADRVLQFYGAALALTTTLTAVYWMVQTPRLTSILSPQTPPVCWPFFPHCGVVRVLDNNQIHGVLIALAVLGVINAFWFLDGTVARAWWLLVGLTVAKMFLVFCDYRLLLNQHYMAAWVLLAFLFARSKRQTIKLLLVLFYVWSGTLKFNHAWLSGAALYGLRPLGLPSQVIPVACAYVVLLECLLSFGLLSSDGRLFWGTLAQLVLFHVSSFWVVGFFYPILMFLLLSILPLMRLYRRNEVVPEVGAAPSTQRRLSYLLPVAFCCAQLLPLTFPGDPSITGEGRAFALHMFDAPVECKATLTFLGLSGPETTVPIEGTFTTPRLSCDPLVYYSYAKDFCDSPDGYSRLGDIDLDLESKKAGDSDFRTVVAIKRFCRQQPHYSMLRHNPWIEAIRRQ